MSMKSAFVCRADGVYDAVGPRIAIDADNISCLCQWAREALRQRARICIHESADAAVHEMMIAVCGTSYIHPHRHTHKMESFHVVGGCADVVFFDHAGGIEAVQRIAAPGSSLPFYLSVRNNAWHTVLPRSDVFVIHEVTNGPFVPAQTELAPWAPAEDDRRAANAYREALKLQLESLSMNTNGNTK